MLAQFHQAHALSQPQGAEFLAQSIGPKPFNNRFVDHSLLPLFPPVQTRTRFLTGTQMNYKTQVLFLLRKSLFIIVNTAPGKGATKKDGENDENSGCGSSGASSGWRIELGSGERGALRPGGRHLRHELWSNFNAQLRGVRTCWPGGGVPGCIRQGNSAPLGTPRCPVRQALRCRNRRRERTEMRSLPLHLEWESQSTYRSRSKRSAPFGLLLRRGLHRLAHQSPLKTCLGRLIGIVFRSKSVHIKRKLLQNVILK